MDALATLAALDSLLALIGRLGGVAAVYRTAREEGRGITMDDVRAARAAAQGALDQLDADIARAEAEGR